MQTQKKNVRKSANCRNRSLREIHHQLYFQLLVDTRRKPDTLFNHAVSISVKMSPQGVIHVTAQSADWQQFVQRGTDLFTFQDHLTHKMCCVNNRVDDKIQVKGKQ
jgi:hypothetical protein